MKKNLSVISIISLLAVGSAVIAMTLGVEPPASYINNLKTCKASTKTIKNAAVSVYTIKGKTADGRCEVVLSSYTNFADKKVYENFKAFALSMSKSFGKEINESNIPTQAQMIEAGRKETQVTSCKFTQEQIDALYEAYQKHDGKNNCSSSDKGGVNCKFSTANMSSYDKLMMNYSMGTCTTTEPYNSK